MCRIRTKKSLSKGLVWVSILWLVYGAAPLTLHARSGSDHKVILDADTANEIDDLFAVVRALLEPSFEIEGLSSAQWNHRLSPSNTVMMSQQLNEDIVRLMNRTEVPIPLGAEMIVGKPWGGDEPRQSAASDLIIHTARSMPAGTKLIVVTLGAVTNVASAIRLAPDIVPRIVCYALMGRYDSVTGVWNKDEFNLRNDLNGANLLFNEVGLELHVMPVNILSDFRFQRDETLKRLRNRGAIWDYLAARWLTHCASCEERIIWDLALVGAIIHPEAAKEGLFLTPPENRQRKIHVYSSIDHEFLLADWWKVVTAQMTPPAP